MGKKNKKSRHYDDDDILGGPPPDQDDLDDDGDGVAAAATTTAATSTDADADVPAPAPADAVDADIGESESAPPPDINSKSKTKKEKEINTVKEKCNKHKDKDKDKDTAEVEKKNIDLIRLEETMTEILRNYNGTYQSEDWLHRSMEKNMHLPKRSLKQSLESHILEEMLARVQEKVDAEYNNNDSNNASNDDNNNTSNDDSMEDMRQWNMLVKELKEKGYEELTAEDRIKLREATVKVAANDPDVLVESVIEMIKSAGDIQEKIDTGAGESVRGGEDNLSQDQLDYLEANEPIAVSILLTLTPYLDPSQSNNASIFLVLRRFLCLFLYTILYILVEKESKVQVKILWEQRRLPRLKAVELAKKREKDEKMLRGGTYLWSNRGRCWIEKDCIYVPPPSSADANDESSDDGEGKIAVIVPPATIRWNETRKQWERWSKNLTTRTKATKQAAAAGLSTQFTKGTFVPIRAGEGWASAPEEPEVENKQLTFGCICFFVCIPATKNGELVMEVVDVTSWATKSLIPKEAARDLGAVDSGRELFSLDVSSLLPNDKKSGKKGKGGGKSHKKKAQNNNSAVDGEEEEAIISVATKGVGCTAIVSKKYSELGKELNSSAE